MRSSSARGRWTIFCVASALFSLLFFHDFLTTRLGSSYKTDDQHLNDNNYAVEPSEDAPIDFGEATLDRTSFESVNGQPPTSSVYARPSPSPKIDIPSARNYTKTLVIAKTMEEDTSWIATELSSEPGLSTSIYTMDDISSQNPIPQNKGHEAMAYLTHIIDKYDNLDDVTLFMHAHRITWHNNDLLESDASKMVRHLSIPHVLRSGYMNLRCHHDPGCPTHLFPNKASEDINIPEAVIMHTAWTELFPGEQVPEVLAQPCCAQIAVSRERIRSYPRARYIELREWILNSELEDRISGRVFEYVWQYLWGGVYEFCPKQNICYCDGYGICFGGEEQYDLFFHLREKVRNISKQVKDQGDGLDELGLGLYHSLVEEKDEIEVEQEQLKAQAFERGKDPRNRAMEAGRPWREGDGY